MGEFQIDSHLSLEESLKGVLNGRISFIEEQIRHQKDVHKIIHETRRTTKRIRAVLHLIRDETGYGHFYRENTFYRDLARRMAPARDQYVLRESIIQMEGAIRESSSDEEFNDLNEYLSNRVDQELYRFNEAQDGFVRIQEELSQARLRVENYCQLRNSFKSVKQGIHRMYERGRKYLRKVEKRFNMEEFHEYRKCSKYLQYQMEIIQPLFPKLMKGYTKTINKHTELLGVARDMDRLEQYLQSTPSHLLSPSLKEELICHLGAQRDTMRARLLSKSGLIYAEKPNQFIKRIHTYWNQYYK